MTAQRAGAEHVAVQTARRVADVAELRRLRADAENVAVLIEGAVSRARVAGVSWDAIAAALEVRGGTYPQALGDLFPSGTSTTTLRRMYDAATRSRPTS